MEEENIIELTAEDGKKYQFEILAYTKEQGEIYAILYPILTVFMGEVGIIPIAISILIALLVVFNHRANIKRIKNGTENKLSLKK